MKLNYGRLVRRSVGGIPIGPYLQVLTASCKYVKVVSIEGRRITKRLTREEIYLPKIVRLCISREKVQAIINGEIVISHPHAPSWAGAKEAEIVLFYSMTGTGRVYAAIDGVRFYFSQREPMVRIIISRILLCE